VQRAGQSVVADDHAFADRQDFALTITNLDG
jgi:hypothetical protein